MMGEVAMRATSRKAVNENRMTTPLEKTLKRELHIRGRVFIIAISPEGLRLTLKGHRKGVELTWESLVSGDAALAVALNASVGQFTRDQDAQKEKTGRSSGVKSAATSPKTVK